MIKNFYIFLFYFLFHFLFSLPFTSPQPVSFDTYDKPQIVRACDLNNDGLEDIIVKSKFGGITWFKKNSELIGDFTTTNLPVTRENPYDIIVDDLDNDGDQDILRDLGSNLKIYENINNGESFITHTIIDFSDTFFKKITISDANLDGFKDIIVSASGSEPVIKVLTNNQNLSFSENELFGNEQPFAISFDFDNDGDLDIFGNCNGFNIYENNEGTLAITDTLSTVIKEAKLIDFDNDNDLDLVASLANEENDFGWFENAGDGFSDFQYLFSTGQYEEFEVLNIDSDTEKELFFINFGDVTKYDQNSDQEYISSIIYNSFNSPDHRETSLNFADFDNDGDLDLTFVNYYFDLDDGEEDTYRGNLNIFENINNSFPNKFILNIDPKRVEDMIPWDVDSDGNSDYILKDGKNIYWSKQVFGTYKLFRTLYTFENNIRNIFLVDINNDIHEDLLIQTESAGIYSIISGSYIENNIEIINICENNVPANEFSVFDLEQDGDLDLLYINTSNGSLYYIKQESDLYFENPELLSENIPAAHKFDIGDFNNDGYSDILISKPISPNRYVKQIYLNDINNQFSDNVTILDTTSQVMNIFCEDLDCDGNIEIIEHVSYAGFINEIIPLFHIYTNLGNLFDSFQTYDLEVLNTWDSASYAMNYVILEDLDLDGDKDIVIKENYTYAQCSHVSIYTWENNRSAEYFEPVPIRYFIGSDRDLSLRNLYLYDNNNYGNKDIFLCINRFIDDAENFEYNVMENCSLVANDNEVPETLVNAINYPNPFIIGNNSRNNSSTIKFTIPEKSKVNISIYNIKGQKIKDLENREFSRGTHNISWNGRNDSNQEIASGVYFYKIKTDRETITKKLLLLK